MSVHEFVDWPGYYKQQRFCRKCGDWESDANIFRCEKAEPAQDTENTKTGVPSQKQDTCAQYPYVLSTVAKSFKEDEMSRLPWNEYVALSYEDKITEVEFSDGLKISPHDLHNHPNLRSYYGRSFRFSCVREAWRGTYGVSADRYIRS